MSEIGIASKFGGVDLPSPVVITKSSRLLCNANVDVHKAPNDFERCISNNVMRREAGAPS